MAGHGGLTRNYAGSVNGTLWYRGGCVGCSWLGPFREHRADAAADARQHLLDVVQHPDPTTHRDD